MKTTKKHFKLYKDECFKWRDILGLKGTELYFTHDDLGEGIAGMSVYDYDGHIATLYLNTEYILHEGSNIEDDIKHTALHEMLHVLTGDLVHMGRERFISLDAYNKEMESLVCRLTSILYKNYPLIK